VVGNHDGGVIFNNSYCGMKPWVKNYMDYYGLIPGDFIPCERCGAVSVDIHHIKYRSHFGTKQQVERDKITNLIALCRKCHEDAHNEKISKEELQTIHDANL